MLSLAVLAASLLSAAPGQSGPAAAPTASCPVFGTFAQQFDGLERPTSVAIAADGTWAVLERDAARIRIYGADGRETQRIEASGEGASSPWHLAIPPDEAGPSAIAFAPDGRITILSPSRIALFDRTGVPWRIATGVAFGEPVAAAWTTAAGGGAGELWIADRSGAVVVCDATLNVTHRFDRGWKRPSGVAIAPDGTVFVADEDADAVVHLDAHGIELGRFGERGSFPGLFNAPRGLAVQGDCLYVTDELNHRITIHGFDGAFRSFWGMHAVVPREGEGKIHYPSAVAIAPDASWAVVAEPMERRVQRFTPSDPNAAMNAPMPSRDGVQSHFGGAVACDGELLLLHEPESSSVFLFDLRDPTPIHVTTFGGAGPGPDRFGRVTALAVDAATQMAVVADLGAGRLSHFHLARDRAAPLKIDPFMATLVRSWELGAWSDRVRALTPAVGAAMLEPVGFATQSANGTATLWTIDRRAGTLVAMDATLTPTRAIVTGLSNVCGLAAGSGGTFVTTLPDRGEVVVLSADGAVRDRFRGPADAPLRRPNAVMRGDDGSLWITDAARDEIVVLSERGELVRRIGARGASDAQLWMPEGLAPFTGATGSGEGPRVVVVDRGNHRAQIFRANGSWLMTFGLGRAYTRPRERGET